MSKVMSVIKDYGLGKGFLAISNINTIYITYEHFRILISLMTLVTHDTLDTPHVNKP